MKKFSILILVVFLTSLGWIGVAQAVGLKCDSGGGLDCRYDVGDVLFGGLVAANAGGGDPEATVQAAIQIANGGVFTDITLLGKSDGGYGNSVSGQSGTWTIPDFASFITVKAANSVNVFAVNPASKTGVWDTLNLITNGGQQANVSHISYWSGPGSVPPGGQVPEPASVLLFGSGLAGLGLWRWKTAKKA